MGRWSVIEIGSFVSDMFLFAVFVGSLHCATVLADVSHLVPAFNLFGGYDASDTGFNGYHYDTPSSPPFFATTTQKPFVLPEIIVNKRTKQNKPSTVYLPPSPIPILPETEPPIVVPPLADDSNVYLPPPAFDTEPPTPVYLPAPIQPVDSVVVDRPTTIYLPPPPVLLDEPVPEVSPPPTKPINDYDEPPVGYQYLAPTKATAVHLRNHKNMDLLRSRNTSNALRLELNDLRCLQHQNGYFRANIIAQSFIETLPIVDTDALSAQCQLRLVRTTFVLNIRAIDFERCGVYACSNNELCVKLRFPQIAGMKSANDALLTLQCKLQERVATKMHALRFGITDIR